MFLNKSKRAITRTFARLALLTSVCCLAIGSLLPAQAQPIMDTSIARFQADATNPFILMQTKAMEQRAAILNEDSSPGRAFELLKDLLSADKAAGRPGLHVGYGQFFSAQNLVRPGTGRMEPSSLLYVKVSFPF